MAVTTKKKLPEFITTEAGEDNIPLTKIIDIALEEKKSQNWCPNMWDYLSELGVVNEPLSKVHVSFDIDPAKQRFFPNEWRNIAPEDWDPYTFEQFFRNLRSWEGSLKPLKMEMARDKNQKHPNDGQYITKADFLKWIRGVRQRRNWDTNYFWKLMAKFDIQKPEAKPFTVSFTVTPGKNGVPDDYDITSMEHAKMLTNVIEHMRHYGKLDTLEKFPDMKMELLEKKTEEMPEVTEEASEAVAV